MLTPLLRRKIDLAIIDCVPYFGVSDAEFLRFKKPLLRRVLKSKEYPEHDRDVPAYSIPDNFIYFPLKDPELLDIFSQAVINHEVGHYLHNQLNPTIIDGITFFLNSGKRPPGHHQLTELVAEYVNFILGLREYDAQSAYRDAKEIYDNYGHEFLPRLSRMKLEDAIKEGIIRISAPVIPTSQGKTKSILKIPRSQ